MWPFVADKSLRLEDLVGPTRIDVATRVLSPNDVTSPVSGVRAAFIVIEAVERVSPSSEGHSDHMHAHLLSLGKVIVGDLVKLDVESFGVAVELSPRRAELVLVRESIDAQPIERAIPELVPLFANAKRGGVLARREHLVLQGDRLRLCAVVERIGSRLIVRDDLAPVVLHEILGAPAF